MTTARGGTLVVIGMLAVAVYPSGSAAGQAPMTVAQQAAPAAAPVPGPVTPPADYVIGPEDVLQISFRREPDMSAEVTVRPDGKITLQVLDDIQAAGLTPTQLRDRVTEAAKRFVEDPSVTIVVRQINSRKAFITGQVARPGAYPIGTRMTVVQFIALAGGLTEYAKPKEVVIVRDLPGEKGSPGGRQTFRFNYDAFQKLKDLDSNIELKPGDTVIVPGS